MFSHSLVAYHAALLDHAAKTSYTFEAALKILEEKPQYNFTVLKDLTQVPVVRDKPSEVAGMTPIDFDQMLFFKVHTPAIVLISHALLTFRFYYRKTLKTILWAKQLLPQISPQINSSQTMQHRNLSHAKLLRPIYLTCWTFLVTNKPNRAVY